MFGHCPTRVVSFPLTLTLSLGEREPPSALTIYLGVVSPPPMPAVAATWFEYPPALVHGWPADDSPSPPGRGRGEGKAHRRIKTPMPTWILRPHSLVAAPAALGPSVVSQRDRCGLEHFHFIIRHPRMLGVEGRRFRFSPGHLRLTGRCLHEIKRASKTSPE